MTIQEAKSRLDKLIAKARVHLYKPIQIAEILYHNRIVEDVDLSNLSTYRRNSTRWRDAVCPRLVGRKAVLNSKYEDQVFDDKLISPETLVTLGRENKKHKGIVESYIYHRLKNRLHPLRNALSKLEKGDPGDFNLDNFISSFVGNPQLRRSVDKVYEIIVYALFDTLTKHFKATVTLTIDKKKLDLLNDFKRFANLVLGMDKNHLSITQPARLFRFGTTNAADTGLDMWANFGPAIQVKHLSLNKAVIADVKQNISADKIVIVCKTGDKSIIQNIIVQLGLSDRIRGFITENDLVEWYGRCVSKKYCTTVGKDVLSALLKEFRLEFPLSVSSEIDAFMAERKYPTIPAESLWKQ